MIPEDLPERELAQQAADAMSMFIKMSEVWLAKVDYVPADREARKFKHRMWNARNISMQMLASLNDEILHRWQIGHTTTSLTSG